MTLKFPNSKPPLVPASRKVLPATHVPEDEGQGRFNHEVTAAIRNLTTQAAAGSLIGEPQVITSGTVYTPTEGTAKIYVEVVGGGGGGGGCASGATTGGAGGGGQAGAWGARWWDVVPGTSYTVAIGAAGAGGVAGNNAGTAGGSTTFSNGVVTVTCPGGSGGEGMAAGTINAAHGGRAGAAPTNATSLSYKGQPGGMAFITISGSTVLAVAGIGASSPVGTGGAQVYNSAGQAASGYGAGGSGGAQALSATNRAGGAGTGGLIRIWEFA